jgi:hypothetical protein
MTSQTSYTNDLTDPPERSAVDDTELDVSRSPAGASMQTFT